MQTEELLLSRDMPILKRTNNNLSLFFKFYPALSGTMPASYAWNHMLDSSAAPKIIYWTVYGCINFFSLVAYNCTPQSYNSQVFVLKLWWYNVSKHSTFERLFL